MTTQRRPLASSASVLSRNIGGGVMDRPRASLRGLTISFLALVAAGFSASASAETRGYVVSWFTAAAYNLDGDCAGGLNPPKDDQLNVDFLAAGISKEKVEAWDKDPKKFASEIDEAKRNLCRIDGQPVSCIANPATMVDPQLHPINGKFAYGFNLDGKGAASGTGFEDPETHEKGVNHQAFRAMACYGSYRGTDKIRTTAWENAWESVRLGMPAWLISISGADLSKDGDATVTFDRALEHVESDANNAVEQDMSFRIDPDPRSHVSFPAKVKDGVVTITAHGDLRSIWGEEMLLTELRLHNTHLRLTMKPDGTLDGIIGGYEPWVDLYGGVVEAINGVDLPGVYWSLRKNADANPDPKTGQNMDISVAYRIEAVPAILGPSGEPNKTAKAGQ